MNFRLDFAAQMNNDTAEIINSFEHPIIVLDEDMRICAKNSATRFYVSGIEPEKSIKGFLSEADFERIGKLESGENISCRLNCGLTCCGATVFKLEKRCFVVVDPVSSRLRESLREVYDRLSGYDNEVCDDDCFGETLARKLRTRSAASYITERLGETMYGQKLAFFDMEKAVRVFSDELKAVGITSDTYNRCKVGRECLAKGTEGEFLLLLAVAIFINDGKNGKIIFETEKDANSVYCRMIMDNFSEHIGTECETEGRFEGELSEHRFWSYLVYLISNANLWETEVEYEGGKTIFTVKIESATPNNSFILREPNNENAKRLAEIFFG